MTESNDVIEVDGVVIAFTEAAYKKAVEDQRALIQNHTRRSAVITDSAEDA